MNQLVRVALGPSGVPVAEVPASSLWDLVEYLSYQRVTVSYHFEQGHFKVIFQKSDMVTAERLLTDWAHSNDPALQHS